MADFSLHHGDNMSFLRSLPDNSLDAIVTDPPYGLGKEPVPAEVLESWIKTGYHEIKGRGFMGKEWDSFIPQPAHWKEVFRVLKPGGHVLSFFGTRTYDWGVLAMRLAGFEIRDCIQWIYGSGFPKSLNISKAIGDVLASKIYEGYGTALKPANEPICVARKPLTGTVANNVSIFQCGGLNIDGCRIGEDIVGWSGNASNGFSGGLDNEGEARPAIGRFPANVIFDEAAAGDLDTQSGILSSGSLRAGTPYRGESVAMGAPAGVVQRDFDASTGGASRFFYVAKASRFDRDYGLTGEEKEAGYKNGSGKGFGGGYEPVMRKNKHPTVKPIELMRYLVRLVKTPYEACKIADFFMGSGTTGIACMLEGINFVGCELEKESFDTATERIEFAQQEYLKEKSKPTQGDLFI